MIKFEWDNTKNKANRKKFGLKKLLKFLTTHGP